MPPYISFNGKIISKVQAALYKLKGNRLYQEVIRYFQYNNNYLYFSRNLSAWALPSDFAFSIFFIPSALSPFSICANPRTR